MDSISVVNGAICITEVLNEQDGSDVAVSSVSMFEADVINLVDGVPCILFDGSSQIGVLVVQLFSPLCFLLMT